MMSEVETYPTLEFLHKVAQKAVVLEEKRHSGKFVKVGIPDVQIKSMMNEETFILPMEPSQPGSELYRRIICKFGITPAILRKLHVEWLFNEEQVDEHINYFEDHYKVKIKRTKVDIPNDSTFTQEDITTYDDNLAVRLPTQPRVTRKPLLDKWLSQPIRYPTEPEDSGNMKYRHLLLYHGFTSDLKIELKRVLGTNSRVNQHMTHMRKMYTIGNQRGKGVYGRHVTPSRFPELSYCPSLHMFNENRGGGTATPQHSATPAPPGANPGADPGVKPSGSQDPSTLPPSKRYLLTQDKLPDLVVGESGGEDLMDLETPGQDILDTPREDSTPLPGRQGSDDVELSTLSRTIGSLTVQQDPQMREQIGQLSKEGVSQFIGSFMKKLTTTPTPIPLPVPPMADPQNKPMDTTPTVDEQNLQISNVMSLSIHAGSATPTPNVPTARKRTGGKVPTRIKTTYLGPVKTPACLTPPSEQESFLREYIPTLIYQYNLAYEQDDSEEMVKTERLLKAATKTLNEAVKWRDPPQVIVENICEEDVKTHVEYVGRMREAVNNLRYAEPWAAADEDRELCRQFHDTLLDLIPKFESCSSSPKQEYVDQAEEALQFNKRMLDGLIAMNKPIVETPKKPGATNKTTKDPLVPPEVADAKSLEEYLPRIKRVLYKRAEEYPGSLGRGEARISARYKTYFNSALANLNALYNWKEVPTKARKGLDLETWGHVVLTANKLREIYHVTRILMPWIVSKNVWEVYKSHHERSRMFGAEIEKAKDIPEERWAEISEELSWYATRIGDPIKLFEEDEPRNRVSDREDSGDNNDDGDDQNNGNEYPSDFPSLPPTDDDPVREDIATSTDDILGDNTPVDKTGEDQTKETPSVADQKEKDSSETTGTELKDQPASSHTQSAASAALPSDKGQSEQSASSRTRGAAGAALPSNVGQSGQPASSRTRGATAAALPGVENKSDQPSQATKQDLDKGTRTRSSTVREQKIDASKESTKDKNTKEKTELSTGGAKPKKPTGKSTRRIDSDSDEGKKDKTSTPGASRKGKGKKWRRKRNLKSRRASRWVTLLNGPQGTSQIKRFSRYHRLLLRSQDIRVV